VKISCHILFQQMSGLGIFTKPVPVDILWPRFDQVNGGGVSAQQTPAES
jgi:hypothetical protein